MVTGIVGKILITMEGPLNANIRLMVAFALILVTAIGLEGCGVRSVGCKGSCSTSAPQALAVIFKSGVTPRQAKTTLTDCKRNVSVLSLNTPRVAGVQFLAAVIDPGVMRGTRKAARLLRCLRASLGVRTVGWGNPFKIITS